jgi:hypothetical protein
MEAAPSLARRLWRAIEPIHAVTYFHPAPTGAMQAAGLKGFWMCYFGGRFAPLGAIGPGPATAMAYGFSPARVARALPDAWSFAAPEDVLAARIDGSVEALDASLPPARAHDVPELASLLGEAAAACRYEGRPLAAGWLEAGRRTDPVGALWLACTVLREHRGDGHVLAGVSLGLRGLDAVLTHVATGAVTRTLSQPSRGWTDEEWEAAQRRLQARGLISVDGRLTKSGGALRRQMEETTDRLAAGPVERLGPEGVERAIELATPMSRHLVDTGVVPWPNPIGAPRP